MQQLETWSVLRGRVRAVADDAQRADFRTLSLDLDDVGGAEGFAAAVDASSAGSVVEIAIPRDTADAIGLEPGKHIELHARLTPAGLFAHPDRTRIVD
ncbi:MAG TPA: hypothetical protein VEK57_24680 [Thermoanaerobaculia bacterium]|nr:hypothetical protein [Thermoanaerobaculia bacterium]